jgi:hypothetical protein
MRWIFALALVLVVLVVATIRAATQDRKHRGTTIPAAEPEVAASDDWLARRRPLEAVPAAATPPPRARPANTGAAPPVARGGVAHVHGAVIAPEDQDNDVAPDDPLSELEVIADDGTRTVSARVSAHGRYALHLPPGRYSIVASAGALVGALDGVVLAAGSEHELDIHLDHGATIEGRLNLPPDLDVQLTATRLDGRGGGGTTMLDGEDGFQVVGLIPGRSYDLEFTGDGVRALTVPGVTAPAAGLDVTIQAAAVVRGAVGFARGTRCPVQEVSLARESHPDDDVISDDGDDSVGPDCRFELDVPGDARQVTVTARGPGWLLEQVVAIPSSGDPAPICLNPPCRAEPLEGLARLRVALDGAPAGSGIAATLQPPPDTDDTPQTCAAASGACELEALLPGQPVSVVARGMRCRGQRAGLVLNPGNNEVSIPCAPQLGHGPED